MLLASNTLLATSTRKSVAWKDAMLLKLRIAASRVDICTQMKVR